MDQRNKPAEDEGINLRLHGRSPNRQSSIRIGGSSWTTFPTMLCKLLKERGRTHSRSIHPKASLSAPRSHGRIQDLQNDLSARQHDARATRMNPHLHSWMVCSGMNECQSKAKHTNVNVRTDEKNILQLGVDIYLYSDADKLIAKRVFYVSWHFGGFVHTMHYLLVFASSHCC